MLKQERYEAEKEQEYYYGLGKFMSKELPYDCPTLTGRYGLSLLINLLDHTNTGEVSRDAEGYEVMRRGFVHFHSDPFISFKPGVEKYIDKPELYDGYIGGMAEEGFIEVKRDFKTDTIKIKLTEQGRVKAEIFSKIDELQDADFGPTITAEDIADIKEEGKIVANSRFTFWKRQVDKGKVLDDNAKRRIVIGAKLFDRYLLLPGDHMGFVFTDEDSLKYNQLSHPSHK